MELIEFESRVLICIALLTILAAVIAALIIFVEWDKPPTPLPIFSVSSLTVSFMNATSSYKIALKLIVRKPYSDSTKTIAYDNIVASLYYDNSFIAETKLFPFKQEERNLMAVVKAKFMVVVDPKIDVGATGDYAVRVFAEATVNNHKWSRKLDVMCGGIWVESGSSARHMKDCRVEGSLDE